MSLPNFERLKESLEGLQDADKEFKETIQSSLNSIHKHLNAVSKNLAELYYLLGENSIGKNPRVKILPLDACCPLCSNVRPLKRSWWFYNKELQKTICKLCAGNPAAKHSADYRRRRIEKLIPADRKCPYCLKVKDRWVIFSESNRLLPSKIGCRSCNSIIAQKKNILNSSTILNSLRSNNSD